MKDMIENGPDISIQGNYVSLGQKQHLWSMENYFLIHRWKPEDKSFAFYTEKELRTLHPTFGHLSVKTLDMLLRRANWPSFDRKTF